MGLFDNNGHTVSLHSALYGLVHQASVHAKGEAQQAYHDYLVVDSLESGGFVDSIHHRDLHRSGRKEYK